MEVWSWENHRSIFWDFPTSCDYLRLPVYQMGKNHTGWRYPSEKYEFVSWDDGIPNIWKVMKFHGSKPPSSTEKMLSFFRWDEKISNIWGIFRVSTGTHLNPMIQTVKDKP